MYSHALEQGGLLHAWPGFPSAQSLVCSSSLRPTLPESVHAGGG